MPAWRRKKSLLRSKLQLGFFYGIGEETQMESLRGIMSVSALAGMYWIVWKYTALQGWKRHATAIFLGLLLGGTLVRISMSREELDAELAAENARKVASAAASQKRAAENARDAAAFELHATISASCEDAAKAALTIPKSAQFSMLQSEIKPGTKPSQLVQYNTFTYKNAFNAELEAAYLCTADIKNFSSTNEVKVLSIKIGRP